MMEATRVRLDKWLWAARFYKTRALAVDAIETGKIEVNGERSKRARWPMPHFSCSALAGAV